MQHCRCFTKKTLIFKVLIAAVTTFTLYQGTLYFLKATKLQERVNPHPLKGYSHCAIPSSMLTNYPLKYLCDFKPKPYPVGSDVLIVTFVNTAWIPMAHNWICSAEKVGLKKNLYLIAFEEGVCSQLGSDVPCFQHPGANFNRTIFSEPEYQKLVIERTRVILKLLSCFPKIALVDADISFLRNPLPYLKVFIEHRDIVFQADSSRVRFIDAVLPHFFDYICGGFIFMKSSRATKRLWLSVLQYQETFLWNDQAGLNICIRHGTQTVKWATLDSRHFPNGQQYFAYDEKSPNNMIVHANHLEDDEKIVRMIGSDVWCYAPVAARMCNGTAYRSMCSHLDTTPEWCDAFQRVCRDKYNVAVTR